MPEKIFTIPINEAFDERDGCPLCRMRDKLEEQTLESALGAAMMEPAIRIEMNREGFCNPHLQAMYRKKNKLALGLILESPKKKKRATHRKFWRSRRKAAMPASASAIRNTAIAPTRPGFGTATPPSGRS